MKKTRPAVSEQSREAAKMVHERILDSMEGCQEAKLFWSGRDDRYYEGFSDGLKSVKYHLEDAFQKYENDRLKQWLSEK